jgi:tetratricopeptide (TPR) repeat protein
LALALKEHGDVNEAVRQWEKVVQIKPDDPSAHFNLGLTMIQNSRYDDAVKHFIEVFDRDEAVVSPSGSCVCMVKDHYPELLEDEPDWRRAPKTWPNGSMNSPSFWWIS